MISHEVSKNPCPGDNWDSRIHRLQIWCYLIRNTEFVNVTPSAQPCYPITLQNFAAFVRNNSATRYDKIYKRLLSEPITASTTQKTHKKTVLDGENGLTHFRPIRSAILRDEVIWCYPIRFPTVNLHIWMKTRLQTDCAIEDQAQLELDRPSLHIL